MLVSDASKSRESVMHTRTHEEIDHLVDGERAAAVIVEEGVERLDLREQRARGLALAERVRCGAVESEKP